MMSKDQAGALPLAASQLSVLLALSRELFQTDDIASTLALAGRTIAEMLQPEAALLILRNGRWVLTGFDHLGRAHDTDTAHSLYPAGMAQLSSLESPDPDSFVEDVPPDARMLSLAVPVHAALASLTFAWDRALPEEAGDGCRRIDQTILELTAAALGKIETRTILEQQITQHRENMANTAAAHAVELALRDEAATRMRMLSLTDVLTGLYNRRGFFVQAERVFKVAQRKRARSAVIFADIDGLKRVNDELGHDAGDGLIRDAAQVFRQSFRQADVVSRLGGDEFVAYTLDDERPRAILDRIEANLRAFNLMQERPYTVSVSAGVVSCNPLSGQSLVDYVLLADEQMYNRKRSRLH
ncbi:diguanylate cyclase [Massilia sp. BSC265]|uniref:GGDEF domain-containing protein n=1 Tax=Massilia sp. BSC265 TaxID=1549812 RepID=UPI000AA2353A|nr:GGDEF domain-containing protein [Massilia sp. BSC265]